MNRLSTAPLLALTCACLGAPAFAQSGGIEIFAGETIFSKGTRLSIAHLYEERTQLYGGSNEIDDPAQREFRRQRFVLGYNYGWNSRVTVGALLPFSDPEAESLGMGGKQTTGDAGVGDLALFGKYRLYTKDGFRTTFNVAFIGGLEVPTGHTGSVGPQPGSGSWDPFAALAATKSLDRWRFDGQFIYKWNTEGTGNFDDSDEWSAGVSAAYRYLHRPYPGASNSAKLGLTWQEETGASQNGASVASSGSERLFLSPALGFHPVPSVDISVKVDIPLYQHYEGQQLGYDFRTFVAFGYRF